MKNNFVIYNLKRFFACSRRTAIYSDRLGLAYYSIPKSASSSVREYFIRNGYDFDIAGHQRLTTSEIYEIRLPRYSQRALSLKPNHESLAIVRNPYERIASCYKDKFVKRRESGAVLHSGFARYNYAPFFSPFHLDMDFLSFLGWISRIPDRLADGHFRSQWRFLPVRDGKIAVDHVIPIERLGKEGPLLMDQLGLPRWDLRPLNSTNDNNNNVIWTDECVKLVNGRYLMDFKLLGYSMAGTADELNPC